MGAIKLTINGVAFPKAKGGSVPRPFPCVIVGEAWYSDLSVGGGPIEPPETPEHPIELPPPVDPVPPEIPEDPTIVKPPPPDGGWGWSPAYGWGYFPGSGGAGPKK